MELYLWMSEERLIKWHGVHVCTLGCWVNHKCTWPLVLENDWYCLFCVWWTFINNVNVYVIYLLVCSTVFLYMNGVCAAKQNWLYIDMQINISWDFVFSILTGAWHVCLLLPPGKCSRGILLSCLFMHLGFVSWFICPSHFGGLCTFRLTVFEIWIIISWKQTSWQHNGKWFNYKDKGILVDQMSAFSSNI